MIGVVLFGVMCSCATALAIVPVAGLTFIGVIAFGEIRMTLLHDSVAATLMAITAPLLCGQSVIASALQFVPQVQSRSELEEQGQLIKLLREFQASGSEWLWELDRNLCIRFFSQAMAVAIGQAAQDIIANNIRPLIDPGGNHRPMSKGVRALFEHFDTGKAFHEIAFPAIDGRWFCLSGRPVIEQEWFDQRLARGRVRYQSAAGGRRDRGYQGRAA